MRLKVLDPELYAAELRVGFRPSYEGDAGIDLRAREDTTIHPGSTAKVPLGVAVQIPRGHVGWVTGRSATHLTFGLFSHLGAIDSGYRGEIHSFLTALGSPVFIERGERICQLIVVPIAASRVIVVEELGPGARGELGLGSTGRS